MTPGGFSHSEICGSKAVCASPQLIAACHVLHRLPVPRHPPYALKIFLLRSITYKVYVYRFVFAIGSHLIPGVWMVSTITLCSFQGTKMVLHVPGALRPQLTDVSGERGPWEPDTVTE